MATTIGRYEIIKELGRGGMAAVVLARDPSFNRQVAIKVLAPQFTNDPQFRARFEREAQVIAALEHACIVPVYDFGQQGNLPYLVMRYMPGGTLKNKLGAKPMPSSAILPTAQRVAEALDAAHKHGVIHRDLKPGNILFDADGHAFLSDFGIAKLALESSTLTGAGMMIGTPEYMSPEQALGQKAVDGRSDVYSFAVVLYEMLSGHHPYDADTPVGLMLKHVTDPVPQLDVAALNLPAECGTVLARALAKPPADRYPTAGALVQDLTAALTSTAPTRVMPVQTPPRPAPAPSVSAAAEAVTRLKPAEPEVTRLKPIVPEPAPKSAPISPPAASPVDPRPKSAPPAMDAALFAHKALRQIACSNCGGAGLELHLEGQVVCKFCGTPNTVPGLICPRCEFVNAEGTDFCENCQQPLYHVCPNCKTKNWGGAAQCAQCGHALDTLDSLIGRLQENTDGRLNRQQREAHALKAAEEASAERRLEQLRAIDRRREQAQAEAMARRVANERRLMLFLLLGAGLLIVLIVAGVSLALLSH